MKKISKLIALTLGLASIVFASCRNNINDATVEDPTYNKKSLLVTVTGDSDYLTFTEDVNGARTIVPAALDESGLDFYYWGTNKLDASDATIGIPKEITFHPVEGTYGRVGSVELDLTTSQYELTLAAVKKGETVLTPAGAVAGDVTTIQGKAMLYATATVDMRYNEKIGFYLTPYTSTTAKGGVALTIGTEWVIPAVYQVASGVTISLNDITTDAVIDTAVPLAQTDVAAMSNATPGSANFSKSNIKPGTYNLKVTFAATGSKSYTWSDTIIVLANQTTTQTVLIPNIIGLTPKAPEEFTARYFDSENPKTGYYDVEFMWTDKSNNEHNFQLDLMDIPADATGSTTFADALKTFVLEMNDTNWKALANTSGVTVESIDNTVYSDPRFIAGSLNANSEYVILSLPLGKRYLARISAANDGYSDFVYCNFDTATSTKNIVAAVAYTSKSATAVAVADLKQFDSKSVTINRFRINYNFVNGSYKETTYTASGEIDQYKATPATQTDIPTLNNDKTADVRYHSQLNGLVLEDAVSAPVTYPTGYYKKDTSPVTWPYKYIACTAGDTYAKDTYYKFADGNTILNPLKVASADPAKVAAAPATPLPNFSLTKNGTSWSAWKLESTSGATIYQLNPTVANKPAQVLEVPSAQSANYKNPNTGFVNLDLFAVYATTVEIYNPADYAILDSDVMIYKGGPTAFATAKQVTSIDNSNTFIVNNDKTGGYETVYIAVRNSKYSSIKMTIKDYASGVRYEAVGSSTQTINDGASPTPAAPDRYILLSSQPANWTTNYTDYFERAGRVYTAVTGASAPTFATNTYYYKEDNPSSSYTYFEIPVATRFAPGAVYTITLYGYTNKNAVSPFTYPLTMNVINSDTPEYAASVFEPFTYSTVKGNYFENTSGTTMAANTLTTWAAGAGTIGTPATGVWEKL